MSELIDREALMKDLSTSLNGHCATINPARTLIAVLRDAPKIDAVPVVHGDWTKKYDTSSQDYCSANNWYYVCSECKKSSKLASHYCQHCGAMMDGKRRESEVT